jgi:hypothetical protein
MGKSITPAGVVPAAIVDEPWQQVAVSFERFCLTAGGRRDAGRDDGERRGWAVRRPLWPS